MLERASTYMSDHAHGDGKVGVFIIKSINDDHFKLFALICGFHFVYIWYLFDWLLSLT